MSNNKNKNWVNGAWLTKNPNYDIINLDFLPEFIKNLEALPKNDKGIRKAQLSASKGDPLKWNICENDFVPDPNRRKSPPTGSSNNTSADLGDGSDLPF